MISIIHPTRNRKKQALKTMSKWLFNADKPHKIEYIFSVDNNDVEYWASKVRIMPKTFSTLSMDCLVIKNYNQNAIQAINYAAKFALGDLFIIVSDDTDCPEHWDTLLLQAFEGKSDFCVKTDDGLQPTLITMPIMDRVYYERYGYVYFEGYRHLFADQELTSVALMTGKYIKLDLKFPHLHYSTGQSPKDEINVKNDLTWRQGELLFNERLKTNFGITEPVMQYSDIKWR